jgi:3-oxoacyl-[acyl-carrier protein] reductase
MKRVLITGGSRGIGAATVAAFAAANWEVVFTYRSREDEANAVAKSAGLSARAIEMDLLDPTSITNALEKCDAANKGFDAVVHNAAIIQDAPFFFMEEKAWSDVIQASLNSFFHINKAVIGGMVRKRSGRIISLVSISGEAGNRGQTNYAAAKGALIAASKSLARELASKNILVNCVSPGIIETEMIKDLPEKEIKDMIPMRRFGRPEEVAKVILFLASDDASYITGEVLRVNGGLYT